MSNTKLMFCRWHLWLERNYLYTLRNLYWQRTIFPQRCKLYLKAFTVCNATYLSKTKFNAGTDTNMKLKQSAMAFVQWVFRQASDAQLQQMGPVILSGLLKLLEQLADDKSK